MNKVTIISCVVIGRFAVIQALMEIGRRIGRRRKKSGSHGSNRGSQRDRWRSLWMNGTARRLCSLGSSHPFRCAKTVNWSGSKTLSGRRTFGLTCSRRPNDQCCEKTSGITFWLDSYRYRRSCLDGRPQQDEAIGGGGECKPVIGQTQAEWFLGNSPVRCGETRRARRIRGG
jgi:hypothetical protein